MNRKRALEDLKAKVEAGENLSGNTEFWAVLEAAFPRQVKSVGDIANAFYGSLDAAKALHDAVLPNKYWVLSEFDDAWTAQIPVSTFKRHEATSEYSPARAWLIAILSALIAQEGNP